MGFLELNTKTLTSIDFKNRYDILTNKYCKNISCYNYDINIIINYIKEMGYNVKYRKSEHSFEISLGKINNKYNAFCYIKVFKGDTILIPSVYIIKEKEYIAGDLFTLLYKQIASLSAYDIVDKLYFYDEDSLKSLISDCLKISTDFKNNIII